MAYLGGLMKIKSEIIYHLNQYMNNVNNYAHLLPRELQKDVFLGMNIYDTNPEDLLTFPLVVISGSSGQMVTAALSGDFASEIYDKEGELTGYLYGGLYNFNIEVEIGTKSTLERETLMDIISFALRFAIRREIEKHGILIKDMSYGGENKIQYDSSFIYTSTLNLQTFSEWYDYHELLPISQIGANVNLQTYEEIHPNVKHHAIGKLYK